ncbi:MAG TPA: protein kinase [Polyangiaceae bacterium]|jgi:hypothetical protein|nr:protein kinase [Polyangiaceae bacterium]
MAIADFASASRRHREIDRFRVVSPLGEGSHGVVYRAVDTADGTAVALKVLRRWHPRALARFKREFRSVVGLTHPNVVRLFELFESGGEWCFTMELVEGVDPRDHVREASGTSTWTPETGSRIESESVSRIRDVLRQLGAALEVLHRAHRVHRDVKPSNLLVTRDGRLVLLDFGVVGAHDAETLQDERLVGTMAYMAPEQARGEHVGPSADAYATGVVLFELLTGRLPFAGGPVDMALAKERSLPPRPSDVASGVPEDLDELCVALLDVEPSRRPLASELAAHGGAATPSRTETAPQAIFGRDAELAVLDGAFRAAQGGRFVAVAIRGEPGIGKTKLLDAFAARVARAHPDVWILRGRSDDRERVPYNAFDSAIDSLARRLARATSLSDLSVSGASALSVVFPVLGQVEWLRCAGAAPNDAVPLAVQARAALVELLRGVAARVPVALFLDDLDGADAESLELLAALVSEPVNAAASSSLDKAAADTVDSGCHAWPLGDIPDRNIAWRLYRKSTTNERAGVAASLPGLALFAAVGAGSCGADAVQSVFARGGDVTWLELGRLSEDAAMELAGSRCAASFDRSRQVAESAAGHPGFVVKLATASELPQTVEEWLEYELGRHSPACRAVLSVIAVAETSVSVGPLGAELLGAAAGADAELAGILAALRGSALVRIRGDGSSATLALAHPRIGAFLRDSMTVAERRERHAALADVLARAGAAAPEIIAAHREHAGDAARAAALFESAAEVAQSRGEAARAVAFYRRALGSTPATDGSDRQRRRVALADALAENGAQQEAALEYRRAALDASERDGIELRRRAAELLLRHGDLAEGTELARELLAAIDSRWAPTPARALASALWERARLGIRGLSFVERAPTEADGERLLHCDVLWTLATSFGVTDAARAADLHTRALRLALDLGEPSRLARSLALEGMHGNGDVLRTRGVLSRAESLASKHGDARGLAFTKFATAYHHSELAEDAEAVEKVDEAVALLVEHFPRAWELGPARTLAITSRAAVGRFRDLRERYELARAEALGRGDRCASMILEMSRGYVDMAADRADEGQAAIERVMKDWPRSAELPFVYSTLALVALDLYRGGTAAFDRLEPLWTRIERGMAYRIFRLRIQLVSQRGLASLAKLAAFSHCEPDGALVRIVERCASLLRRENLADSRATSHVLLGQLDSLRGDDERAARHYRGAVELYSSLGLCGSRIAGARLAETTGDAEGAACLASNEAWARDERIVDLERFNAALAPIRPRGERSRR